MRKYLLIRNIKIKFYNTLIFRNTFLILNQYNLIPSYLIKNLNFKTSPRKKMTEEILNLTFKNFI